MLHHILSFIYLPSASMDVYQEERALTSSPLHSVDGELVGDYDTQGEPWGPEAAAARAQKEALAWGAGTSAPASRFGGGGGSAPPPPKMSKAGWGAPQVAASHKMAQGWGGGGNDWSGGPGGGGQSKGGWAAQPHGSQAAGGAWEASAASGDDHRSGGVWDGEEEEWDEEEDENWNAGEGEWDGAHPQYQQQQPYGVAAQSGWMSWGEEARKLNSKVTHSTAQAPTYGAAGGSRRDLSSQQRSQILDTLLNHHGQAPTLQANAAGQPQGRSPQHASAAQQRQHEELQMQRLREQQARLLAEVERNNNKKKQKKEQDLWGGDRSWTGEADNSWGDGWGDAAVEGRGAWGDSNNRRVHFPPSVDTNIVVDAFRPSQVSRGKSMGGGQQPEYEMPSKTLSYARQGTDTSFNLRPVRNAMQDYADVKFIESKGAALAPVQRAFFSKSRPARQRFHWMFPPDKDERVASLLGWIQAVSYGLGTYGVCGNDDTN